MSIAFAAEALAPQENVVSTVFERGVLTFNETKAEAKVPAGRVAIVANHRGFTSGKGKRARGQGQAVVDLSALSRIPASELTDLISYLEDLNANAAEGVAQAESK